MGKVLFFCIFLTIGSYQIANAQSSIISSNVPAKKIIADVIVVKLKTPKSSGGRVSSSHDSQLDKLKDVINYADHHQVFAKKSFSNARLSSSRLQNIYKIKLNPGSNIWHKLAILRKLDFIEYAEPFFQNELLFIPNDPQANPIKGKQDYLTVIKAYEGWQIDQSDSSVVIGIVDTGVKMDHEDLGNIAFNHADPINGIDDDGDGYIDNYFGWDLANKDNDPTADGHPHGSAVAGMSSATTNNGIGMAGIGFKSKYLPVKIADTNTKILMNEYEGVVYAADHGCSVINLSWGGVESSSKYGQDIINYAVLERDVVVIAAAGNTPDLLNFYPASFDNVLSVGATDIHDNLASWATYSNFIDIVAPGNNVYSTKNNGGYEKTTGTSFSAPIVAGAAALVRSHFPELSAQQVMEQLRVTSDDIYNVGSNMNFYGLMGRGRLNVQRALSDILTPAIRLNEFHYVSNHGDLIFPGDSVNMYLKFTNFLRNAENVSITISNPSNNVSMEIDKLYIDKLGEFESFENNENPVFFTVNPDVQPGERLLFRIDFVGNNYTDFQYIEIIATPEYFDISDGNLTATISSDGDIGFDGPFFRKGNGVSYKEDFLAIHTGLIISLDSTHVMDNVINNFDINTRDEDFIQETNARIYDNSQAKYDARSLFKPVDTISSALDIKIEQKILTWENNTNDGYIIFEYRIINSGDSALTGLNAGLFADWDLGNKRTNEAAWDVADNFGYVFDKSSNESYAGIALLTNQTSAYYSIDIESQHGNIADIDSLFTEKMKHQFLSSSPKASAGSQGTGNNVAQIIGGKNINLEPNQSIKVSFAMLASTSLEGLRSALSLARGNYANYLNDPPLLETFYACFGDSATIDPEGEIYEFYADVAATQRLDSGTIFKTNPVLVAQEYYVVNLDSGYAGDVMKIVVQPGNATADFILPEDTLLIESGNSNSLRFDNISILSDQWIWDFGNGYTSIIENPSASYQSAGQYTIELIANNKLGCADTTIQNLLVAQRSERAVVEDQQICTGTMAIISASNTNQIKVYKENDLLEVIFEGDEFLTNAINTDTTFYVTNINGDFESIASEINITVKHPKMGFEHQIDTLNLEEKYVLNVRDMHGGTDSILWLVNGSLKGDDKTFSHVYSYEPFNISQIKVDEDGCTDTLRVTFSPEYSNIPGLVDVEICKNSDLTIRPENGEIFYFYEDISLNNLLHKGKTWELHDIQESEEYFVTGVDALLEGASASIKVTLDPAQAIIESSLDTIDLADENQVELLDNSMNSTDSYWHLFTGARDTSNVLIEVYDTPGTYDYTLIAEGNNGCTDTAFQSIRVVYITALEDANFEKMRIYPNPVNDFLTIDFGKYIKEEIEFELIDISGKRIKHFTLNGKIKSHQLSFASLKNGIYFLRSLNVPRPITAKILKQ